MGAKETQHQYGTFKGCHHLIFMLLTSVLDASYEEELVGQNALAFPVRHTCAFCIGAIATDHKLDRPLIASLVHAAMGTARTALLNSHCCIEQDLWIHTCISGPDTSAPGLLSSSQAIWSSALSFSHVVFSP